MVLTSDEKLFDMLKVLRNHGSTKTYHYEYIGNNSRLDEIQAAILRIKLKHLDDYIGSRRRNAALYNELLKGVDEVRIPKETERAMHTYNQYTLRAKNRDKLAEHLRANGIGAMIYYPLALHLQKVYKGLGYKSGDLPETEKAQNEVISLPIFPELVESQIREVVASIKDFYAK